MIRYNTKKESNWQWQLAMDNLKMKLERIGKFTPRNNIKPDTVGGAYYMTFSDSPYQATWQKRYSQSALGLGAESSHDVFLFPFSPSAFLFFSPPHSKPSKSTTVCAIFSLMTNTATCHYGSTCETVLQPV